MNYIFISPAYPVTCRHFCERLSRLGVNVLGIGDVQYDDLSNELKNALTEYYYVDSLEDYDQVYRAAAFYIHKYGRIDWLESLNEYWLPMDARLRTDFNIAVGTRVDRIRDLVKKSGMKKIFIDAGIPTARQHIVSDPESGKAFAALVGFPVIVKPDIGVGANGAMKIDTEEELTAFYNDLPDEPYVMEEFLCGDICAYAARKDGHDFTHSREEIMERYGNDIVMQEEMPEIDWPSMGGYVYMARFREKADMDSFFSYVLG